MRKKKATKKDQPFEVVIERANVPDIVAEERLFRALSIIMGEDDILNHL